VKRPLLLPFVPLYLLGYWLHALGIRILGLRKKSPIPTLVIGNPVVGGSGKTPITIALAQDLRANGLQIAVLSRGYGRSSRGLKEVCLESMPEEVGDEALEIKFALGEIPVVVDGNRHRALSYLKAKYPSLDWVLLDDGLQHHRLQPDISLMLWHQKDIVQKLWPLPAGNLRQWPIWPPPTLKAISYAKKSKNGIPALPIQMEQPLDWESKSRVSKENWGLGWTGLARPEALVQQFPEIHWLLSADHTMPSPKFWEQIEALGDDKYLLCTMKDSMRLGPHRQRIKNLAVVPLRLDKQSSGYRELVNKVIELCTRSSLRQQKRFEKK
jgi:tetraacyldisaccharide-1-P 4'-kinase